MVSSKRLALLGLLGLLHWFFGNLYEAIVFSPNWVVESTLQLERMHGIFERTSPTLYFVPITQVGTVLVWAAHAINGDREATADFRRATAFALLATALNAYIVATIVTILFGSDFRLHSDAELHSLCVRWNILNGVRLALTAATLVCLFTAFRKLDRKAPAAARVSSDVPYQ
jgi:hypothetical protein